MEHYVIAYAFGDGLLNITKEDTAILTHINIAFGILDEKGLLSPDRLKHLDIIPKIRQWNQNIKIVLSVGGWGAGGFSTMSMTETGRKSFAKSCLDFINEYNFDGIDIDWEYPGIDWAGIDASPRDKENFTLLLKELRNVLGTDKILSIAAGAEQYYLDQTEMSKIASICDYIQIMTYDMRGDGYPSTGHHTALFASSGDDSEKNVHDAVCKFKKAGVPSEKIIIGAAFYARMWKGVTGTNADGLMLPAKECGFYGASYSQLVNDYINKNGFVRYKDEKARAPYLYNGDIFVSYDDPESISEKCRYIKEHNLLGIMYWEHGQDMTHTLLKNMLFM